uniref:Variant surface glycoprotein (VSG), putative n=2 Tax=Trypanosoma brucei TaxID=5691 RepID=Q4FKR0_TRYB2|nr:variant surface glycoprotein 454 [Trypanosoma brucei]CAJ16478.1 variant surface glycoprotein (VSG), putative [Trypanosoma brucei brucei TREU927]
MKVNIVLTVILLIIKVSIKTRAAIGTGENAAAHAAICTLLRLSTATITVEPPANNAQSEYKRILKLNMSVADSTWQEMFFKSGEKAHPHKTPKDAGVAHVHWDESWQTWPEAAQGAAKGDADTDIKASGFAKLTGEAKEIAQLEMRKIAAATARLTREISENGGDGTNFTAAINKAAYGEEALTSDTPNPDKVIVGDGNGNTRESLCVAKEGATATPTILGAAACICHKAHTSNQDDVCGQAVTQATAWNSNTNKPDATDLKTLLESCGKGGKVHLTAASLRAKLETVRNQIKTKSGDNGGYLGAFINSCNGEKTAGICLKVENFKADARASYDKIPWVSALNQLAGALEERNRHNSDDAAATQQLKEYIAHTNDLVANTNLLLQQKTAVNGGNIPQQTAAVATKDCEKQVNKTAEQCTKLGCDHDAENKKCKPKDGTENTAAGTGTGAAGEEKKKKCAKHRTDKDTCDKDSNCKWTDNTCKDSSFLINKKLALSMAAAFGNFIAL